MGFMGNIEAYTEKNSNESKTYVFVLAKSGGAIDLAKKVLQGTKKIGVVYIQSEDQLNQYIEVLKSEKIRTLILPIVDDYYFINEKAELLLNKINTSINNGEYKKTSLVSVFYKDVALSDVAKKIDLTKQSMVIYDNSKPEEGLSAIRTVLYYSYGIGVEENEKIERIKESKKFMFLCLSTVILLLGCFYYCIVKIWGDKLEDNYVFGMICFGILIVLSCVFFVLEIKSFNNLISEDEYLKYSKKLEAAQNSDNKFDVLNHRTLNLEQINHFYIWTQQQARKSFNWVRVMCIVGAIIIASPIVIYIFGVAIPSTAAVAIAVTGAIVELIAGVVLIVYKNSMSQLDYYHKALHEDQRFLSNVALAEKFTDEADKNEMFKEIIRGEIKMSVAESEKNAKEEAKKKVKFRTLSKAK